MTPSVECKEIIMFRKNRFFILGVTTKSANQSRQLEDGLQEETICPEGMDKDYRLDRRVDMFGIVRVGG
jgi:hypothetical protein